MEPDPIPTLSGRSADKCQAHGHGRSRSAPPAAAPAQSRDGLAGHPLAGTALPFQGRLESMTVAGGWFGRVARVAADALPQAAQLGSQCGELLTHQLIPLTQQQEILPLQTQYRCNRESGCRQGLGRLKAISRSSHQLNGYNPPQLERSLRLGYHKVKHSDLIDQWYNPLLTPDLPSYCQSPGTHVRL